MMNEREVCIIIPARLGSKGFPLKNRKLFDFTAKIIPDNYSCVTYVTTDDPEIKKKAKSYNFNVIDRPNELAADDTSTQDVLIHAINKIKCSPSTLIVMLYLTYPERTWTDVVTAFDFFDENSKKLKISSLLCRKEVNVHPYLCLIEVGPDGVFGNQLTEHNLYRRQDYPICFEISHFISMFVADQIHNLNKNLYSKDTIFYKIDNVIDVDFKKDFDKFNGK